MTTLTEPNHAARQEIGELAKQNKQLLDSLFRELSRHVDELENHLKTLSPQSSLHFNSTEHSDVGRHLAKSGLSLMRICAALDIDFTAAVDAWVMEQESALFAQQDLDL